MITHKYCRFAIFCILLLTTKTSRAQFLDSLEAKIGLESRFSSRHYQPLWLVANKYGTVADRKNDLSPFIRISNKHTIAEPEYQNGLGFYDYNPVNLSYGLSVYNNNHFKSTIIEEGYVKLEYKNWSLRAGRFEETTGDIDPDLSTGSLGISANALPIPKIGIAVTDYTNIPFTGGWLQFKGTFAHGWLGSKRYIKDSYYHEKTFFLRVGAYDLKFYGGIQHFVEWGGKNHDHQFDKSLKNFWNVFFAKGTDTTKGLQEGDQRGVLQAGMYWENNNIKLHGYLQKPFEGKQDISLRNKNMLVGFVATMKNNYIGLQKILFEVISTKNINTHITPTKRESYYNNNVYKTGWEYQGNIIGTPLFLNRERANKYFPEIQPFDWDLEGNGIPPNANVINNRVFGIHIGTLYSFNDRLLAKTLLTYTENYGTLNNDGLFVTNKNQFYALQEVSYDIPKKNLTIKAGLGLDFGQLSKTAVAGGLLGIAWQITSPNNNDGLYY